MKMIAEYLDRAMQFEHIAAIENDPGLKAKFLVQAADCRKLAEKRAGQLGVSDSSK